MKDNDKVLILDYEQWRCGGNSINQLGEGETCLLNKEGFMCCLGQFSLQLADDLEMLDKYMPGGLNLDIPLLTLPNRGLSTNFYNSLFSLQAVGINDNRATTPKEKIEQLKELCAKKGYDLVILNEPK
jgi:hypothetical protein